MENRASRPLSPPKRHSREKEGNTICYPKLVPTTLEKYDYTRISRNESIDLDFPNLSIPTPKYLKLFERKTSRSLSKEVKDDVLNIRDSIYLFIELTTNKKNKIIVYRVADSTFKGLTTIIEILIAKLLKGKEL
ncbi:hypothetical protein N7527_006589 [Penicillium freii]|nr:hypothetical protein N7527_006589 [Penicillium freii]